MAISEIQRLIPMSFHLRNFNKYLTLDVNASEDGNLTLIGENAAGKTTLANCFFPMLIDGSLATPAFNSAQDTTKLESKKARNSARDTRTFESMLLSWGPGAMQSRTGYSYLTLRSKEREVILGLGAHRANGDLRRPTWWFVAMSSQLGEPLKIVTVDDDGKSLDKAAFIEANEVLGSQLRVFDQSADYRDYVATTVYGFTGPAALSKLVNVYRLLASPILTAGNARFTPIREALKNAQEGIDPQIMMDVADTQRNVNQTNRLQQRLIQAKKRLTRMQKVIFWSNLNHLQELIIEPYSAQRAAFDSKQTALENAQQKINKYADQLKLLKTSREQAAQTLDQLKDEQIRQRLLVEEKQKDTKILRQLKINLDDYRKMMQQLQTERQELATVMTENETNETNQQALLSQKVQPAKAKLAGQVEKLHGLNDVLGFLKLDKIISGLTRYIRDYRKVIADFDNNRDSMQHISQDVEIVMNLRDQLDTRIDERMTGALVSHYRTGLHQDNQEVHDAGAAKMNQFYQELMAQQKKMKQDFPDLGVLLVDKTLMKTLDGTLKMLIDSQQKLQTLKQEQLRLQDKLKGIREAIEKSEKLIDPDFDEAEANVEIKRLQQEINALKIDPQIDQKVVQADLEHQKLVQQINSTQTRQSEYQGQIETVEADKEKYETEMNALAARLLETIVKLKPYAPFKVDFSSVTKVIDFMQQNGAEIRNHNYSQLVDQIGRLIHHNNENGVDINALDDIFEERGHTQIASEMRQQRSVQDGDVIVVAFDLQEGLNSVTDDQNAVAKSLATLNTGNEFAQHTYLAAAAQRINAQYRLIDSYNDMLRAGVGREQSIKLKVELVPTEVTPELIDEARNPMLTDQHPLLSEEIRTRLARLAADTSVADDEDAFMDQAKALLDTRQWSEFRVLIKRRQSAEDDYEVVDDKFVQSGGSGAEKAQAMVLPLLLVPKMVLQQAKRPDAPYLVMFDEFADKLDPETAKSFAKTISRFGFNFLATMPEGAQNKILADGVANIAYDVIAADNENDGLFHPNTVAPVLTWQSEGIEK